MDLFEQPLASNPFIAGVDEVGRGPLIGDVVAAAVILPAEYDLPFLTDSKKLSEKKREALAQAIQQQALAWAIGRASPQEIDQLNILQASLLAMRRAVEGLSITPGLILVDGKFCPPMDCPCRAIIKGDLTEPSISAASIIAKVARDADMRLLDQLHPDYGFAQHKGYPTAAHLACLQKLPLLPEYRQSFKPVARWLQQKG
jgi:ribonuclease HII